MYLEAVVYCRPLKRVNPGRSAASKSALTKQRQALLSHAAVQRVRVNIPAALLLLLRGKATVVCEAGSATGSRKFYGKCWRRSFAYPTLQCHVVLVTRKLRLQLLMSSRAADV